MESKNTGLIKISNNQLAKAGDALAITNKLLAKSNEQRIINFFLKSPDFFLKALPVFYRLKESTIEKYKDKLRFGETMIIENNPYSQDVDPFFKMKVNFYSKINEDKTAVLGLSANENILWSDEFIEKYIEKWNWYQLSNNKALPWSEELIERYKDKWVWGCPEEKGLTDNPNLPWSIDFIEKYKGEWNWGFHFTGLSANKFLPWSNELLEKFKDKWDFQTLAWNKGIKWTFEHYEKYYRFTREIEEIVGELPWSLNSLQQYIYDTDWRYGREASNYIIDHLSYSNKFLWTDDLINSFETLLNWTGLSGNTNLKWSIELIERYEDKWNWGVLSENANLPWSENFFYKYINLWNFKNLSNNKNLSWTFEFIEKYEDKWEWGDNGLSANSSLPWSIELIEKYKEKWSWSGLSNNAYLPWSIELLEEFKDNWYWLQLCDNNSVPWSLEIFEKFIDKANFTNVNQWDKAFKPYLTDEMIEKVFDMLNEK